jgi:hypothetical protein
MQISVSDEVKDLKDRYESQQTMIAEDHTSRLYEF